MKKTTSLTVLLLAASGTALSLPATALATAKVIRISGATLLENLIKAPGTTNDYIDVDGDGVAGSLGSLVPDQLAPFDATLNYTGPDEVWVVEYDVVGSVQGVQELVDFGRPNIDTTTSVDDPGLDILLPLRALAYHNRTLYINGGVSVNAIFNVNNPGGHPVRGTPTYDFTNSTSAPDGVQIDIAPTDVPTAYAITKPGVGAVIDPERNPFELGYGLNPTLSNDKATGADNGATQLLASLTGARNINEPENPAFVPNTDTIYDTPISYSPIAAMVSLGVGRSQITTTELRHLTVTGRLPSGQNLVMITRDAGSGTRNGFMNSIGIDPSFGAGDNVGPTNTGGTSGTSPNLLGPNYIPTNKVGSSDVERTLRNVRIGVCYSGAERAVATVTGSQMEILAVKNDHKAGNIGTEYSRPSFTEVANNTADGYRIGGFSVLASLGDPKAEPIALGGLANGEIQMSNSAAAAYLNNIRRSIEDFVSVPASPDNELMPAEAIVKLLLLPEVLSHRAVLTDPDAWASQTQDVPLYNASQTLSTLTNAIYSAFGTVSINGQSPSRTTGVSYTDNNGVAGSFYVLQDGTTLNYNVTLSGLNQRNRIAGDANGDGLRDVNDIPELVKAYQSTAPAPGVPGSWAAPNGIFGAGSGAKASREILFDFNGDGNFTALDVRYFADGFATGVTGSNNAEGNLDRVAGFTAVDNAAVGLLAGNLFATTLQNSGATYNAGDSRADVAGAAGTAPGWAPVGADGVVDQDDIDYVYDNFGNWSVLSDAAGMDLSCDMDGDLDVDQDDVCVVLSILETSIGDVDLDGDVDAIDLATATANLGSTTVGFAGGDVDGDGAVTALDISIINGSGPDPCNPAPACTGDVNGDGDTNISDFNILAGNFGATVTPNTGGDLTGDGLVNISDFNILAGDFGCATP